MDNQDNKIAQKDTLLIIYKPFWIIFGILMVIIILLIPILVFIKLTPAETGSENTQALNAKLTQVKDEYNKASGKQKEEKLQEMVAVAKERKEELRIQIKTNPQEVLDQSISTNEREEYPQQIQEELEQQVTLTGEAIAIQGHSALDPREAILEYWVRVPIGKEKEDYVLHFTSPNPSIVTGTTVAVQGVAIDSDVAVKNLDQLVHGIMNRPQVLSATSGVNVAVIPIKFQNSNPTRARSTRDEINAKIFTNTDSTKAFFNQMSFNQSSFTGQVFDWVTIPVNLSHVPTCNYLNFGDMADTIIGSSVLSGFAQKAYIFNWQDFTDTGGIQCQVFSGLSEPATQKSWHFNFNPYVVAQEIGHGFAINHDGALMCAPLSMDNYANCEHVEYGNQFSVMGSGSNDMSAAFKDKIGWIPPSNVQTVTANGIYTISPLESSSSSTQLIKIAKSDTLENYYIEYRTANRFGTSGISLIVWDDNTAGQLSKTTKLIDLSPSKDKAKFTDLVDSLLFDGGIFYDQINKISIKQISHTTTAATIEVKFNPTDIKLSPCSNLGNVDQDGVISIMDINWLSDYINKSRTFSTEQIRRAKLNSDSVVDDNDLQLLQNYLNGTVANFPACISTSVPLLNNWTDLTSSVFPQPVSTNDAVYDNGYIFVGTGSPNFGIHSASVDSPTSLGGWNKLTTNGLPTFLDKFRMVTAKGYLFILGGNDLSSSGKAKGVYSARINSDGTIGSWNIVTPLPNGNFHFEAVVADDYLFVIGGYDDFGPTNAIYSAQINNDGTLGAWGTVTTAVLPRIYSTAAIYKDGYIYIFGGNLTNRVCSVTGGNINNCTTQNVPPLVFGVLQHRAVLFGNTVFIIGGETTTGATAKVYSTTISGGTVGSWVSDRELPIPLSRFGVAATEDTIFTIGGYNGSGNVAKVYSVGLTSAGSSTPSPSPSPSPIPSPSVSPTPTPISTVTPTPITTIKKVNFGIKPLSLSLTPTPTPAPSLSVSPSPSSSPTPSPTPITTIKKVNFGIRPI